MAFDIINMPHVGGPYIELIFAAYTTLFLCPFNYSRIHPLESPPTVPLTSDKPPLRFDLLRVPYLGDPPY